MTTTITLHVNGRYRAYVKQDSDPWVTVEGNYDGSPNPDGRKTFNLRHASSNKFVVNEESIDEKPGDPSTQRPAKDAESIDGTAQGDVLEIGITGT